MIAAFTGETEIVFAEGEVRIDPLDEKLARKFTRRARAIVGGEEEEDGIPVHVRREIVVDPGSGRHFRAVLRTVPGVRILIDDGDE